MPLNLIAVFTILAFNHEISASEPRFVQNIEIHANRPYSIFSDLDLAVQLTSYAKKTNPGHFICQTWIFPWWMSAGNDSKDNTLQMHSDLFSESYAATSNPVEDLMPLVIVPIFGDESLKTNFSYSREFELDDIIHPNILGFRRLVTNCFSVLISSSDPHKIHLITTGIIVKKYARPHKDFFIYIGELGVLQSAFRTFQISELRYTYGLAVGNGSVLHFHNQCQRPGEELGLFSRRCDSVIGNRHYLITACFLAPMVNYEDNPDGTRKSNGGVLYFMFQEASVRHNYTFDIRYAHFNGASGFKKNGVWKGAVGEVLSREADIAFAVAISVHRIPIADPSVVQVWITRMFYIRTPPFKTSWLSIFWPLSMNIWLLTLSFVLLLVLPVYYWAAARYFKTVATIIKTPDYILGDIFEALFRILMEQSATLRNWKGTRIRLLVILWAAFALVLGTGYRAKLVSFLTFLQQEDIPGTHMELSLSNYKLLFRLIGGVAYRYTVESPDPMHKRILQKSLLVNTSEDCMLTALLEDRTACLDYRINSDFTIQRNTTINANVRDNGIFVKSKDTDFTCIIVWSFRKGSPWTESFDKVILFSMAGGLYDVWKNKEWYFSRVDSARHLREDKDSRVRERIEQVLLDLSTGPKALNNSSLMGLWLILALGLIVGSVSYGVEGIDFMVKMWLGKYKLKVQARKRKESWRAHGNRIAATINGNNGNLECKSNVVVT